MPDRPTSRDGARTRRRTLTGALVAAGFIGTIALANWLTSRFGFVPVGFGFTATAGTFAAGFALALRDLTQDTTGRLGVLAVIIGGAALSFLIADPLIAAASGAAFLISELADFAVYTPLRARSRLGDRRWTGAVIASNAAGAIIDTVAFLGIAFGAAAILPAMAGQLVGKSWATIAYLAIGLGVARALFRQPVNASRS